MVSGIAADPLTVCIVVLTLKIPIKQNNEKEHSVTVNGLNINYRAIA